MNDRFTELEERVSRLESSNSRLVDDNRLLHKRNRLSIYAIAFLAALPIAMEAGAQLRPVQVPPALKATAGQLPFKPLNIPVSAFPKTPARPKGLARSVGAGPQALLGRPVAITPVIKTQLLAIVDGSGQTCAILSTDGQSNPSVSMFDKQGNVRMVVGLSTSWDPSISFVDENGVEEMKAGMFRDSNQWQGSPGLAMNYRDGTRAINMGLGASNPNGNVTNFAYQAQALQFFHPDGRQGAWLGTMTDTHDPSFTRNVGAAEFSANGGVAGVSASDATPGGYDAGVYARQWTTATNDPYYAYLSCATGVGGTIESYAHVPSGEVHRWTSEMNWDHAGPGGKLGHDAFYTDTRK